jgi:hypothetical protein
MAVSGTANAEHETSGMISADQLRALFEYDPESGVVTWRAGKCAGREAGTVHKPRHAASAHRRIHIGSEFIFAHHVAFACMTNTVPVGLVDHINSNGLDNRWSNLRLLPLRDNIRARGPRRDNVSGFIGVTRVPSGKWRATLRVDGHLRYLGTFADAADAARFRDEAARRYHGDVASLNYA